ncbi:MAG: hypothetical protein V3S89_04320 [Desulfobacterales bacterium]
MEDRPDTRPEIEPHFWDFSDLKWPIQGKTKPDLIIFDLPAIGFASGESGGSALFQETDGQLR